MHDHSDDALKRCLKWYFITKKANFRRFHLIMRRNHNKFPMSSEMYIKTGGLTTFGADYEKWIKISNK